MKLHTHRQRLSRLPQRPSVDDTRQKLNTERCAQHGDDYKGIHLSGDHRGYVWHTTVRIGPHLELRSEFLVIDVANDGMANAVPSTVSASPMSWGLLSHLQGGPW